jgi:hypothetical protein
MALPYVDDKNFIHQIEREIREQAALNSVWNVNYATEIKGAEKKSTRPPKRKATTSSSREIIKHSLDELLPRLFNV